MSKKGFGDEVRWLCDYLFISHYCLVCFILCPCVYLCSLEVGVEKEVLEFIVKMVVNGVGNVLLIKTVGQIVPNIISPAINFSLDILKGENPKSRGIIGKVWVAVFKSVTSKKKKKKYTYLDCVLRKSVEICEFHPEYWGNCIQVGNIIHFIVILKEKSILDFLVLIRNNLNKRFFH